jgi:hypothetical protein
MKGTRHVPVHITLSNGGSYDVEGSIEEVRAQLNGGGGAPVLLNWEKPGGTQPLLVNPDHVVVAHEPLRRDVGFS